MLEETNKRCAQEQGDDVDVSATTLPGTMTTNTIEAVEAASPSKAKLPDVISLTDQTNLLPFKKVIAVFCGLSLCILVSTLDSTIVATALPTISDAFNAGAVVSWVPSAYLLTSTAFQPLCKSLICNLSIDQCYIVNAHRWALQRYFRSEGEPLSGDVPLHAWEHPRRLLAHDSPAHRLPWACWRGWWCHR